MKKLLKKGKRKSVIILPGELTIYNAGKVRDAILEAMKSSPAVELRFGAIESLDLSFLQLIHSAYLTAQDRGKGFQVHGGILPGQVQDLCVRTGFDRTSGFFSGYCRLPGKD